MFRLLRYFSLTSAVAIVVASAVLLVIYRNTARGDLIESVEQQNVFLAESLSNSIWPRFKEFVRTRTFGEADSIRSRPEIQTLHEALRVLTKDLPVLKVKIYNVNGLTVYSSQASQIGEDKRQNPGFRFVLDEALPASKLAYKGEFSAFSGVVYDRDLVETYVPIQNGDGPIEAVFELYSDVTPLMVRIDQTVGNLLIVLTIVFGALYVVLFLIVRRGDGILRREMASRRRAEEQLVQFQKIESLGNLSGGMAHNLNNLLYPILALSNRTRDELPENSLGRERLDKVVEAGERAKAIVEQVLRFSHKSGITEEPIDIQSSVRNSLEILRSTIPTNVIVKDELDDTAGTTLADAAQIGVIVMNLASNATDALRGTTGEMKISLTRVDVDAALADSIVNLRLGAYAKLTVNDTGPGMDDDTERQMFDPFFTTKNVGEGTGLGLSSVFGIVSSLGGAIEVSSAPGAGTTVDVYLPISDDENAPSAPSEIPVASEAS